MKKVNLYFVRHGQTEWNLQNRLQGSQNSPLTVKGIEDAKLTGVFLKNIDFSFVYSSPLPRAIDTRDYILAETNHNGKNITRILPDLAEMDYGDWEGLNIDDLMQFTEFRIFRYDAMAFDGKRNKGENYQDVFMRAVNAIDEIIDKAQNSDNILIVSHGNFLRLILCHLSGLDWKKHRDSNYFPVMLNAALSVASCEVNLATLERKFHFTRFNDIKHLEIE